LLLHTGKELTETEQVVRLRLLEAAPEIRQAQEAVEAFREILRVRMPQRLEPWLDLAAASPIAELRSFAASLRRDYAAVLAACTVSWSSGQVEGTVAKVKLVKRQMFGRANFDLLRRRVLLAG
jgi:transposase